MTEKIKAVLYLNQFFGQIGAEDKADTQPLVKTGPVGPGILFQELLGPEVEITATIILPDTSQRRRKRCWLACGAVCAAVTSRLGIPAVTGMFPENPGVESCRKTVYIVATKGTTAGMRDAAGKMSRIALKLAKKESIGPPEEEGYLPRGIRRNYFAREIRSYIRQ